MTTGVNEPTKKCHACHIRLKLEDTKCYSCGAKVGPPDKNGISIKPVNWLAYIEAVIGIVAMSGFFYWLFYIKN